MSDDDLESIRERKRERLAESVTAGESTGREESTVDETSPKSGANARNDDTPNNDASSDDAPNEPIHVESVEQFSAVTTDYDAVLVDFYAGWCGPCKMLEPVVASVAQNTDAAVAKVDIDEHQGLAAQYGVRSVPTLVLFADGEQVEQLVGMQDEAMLTNLVERFV